MMATFVGLGSINTSCSRDNEPVASDGDQKAPISFNVNIGTLPTPTVTTRGYTTNSSESGYTFNGDEYVAVGLTHPSGSEVIKQYLVGAGNSGGNSLTYKKEADGTTTGYTFDWHSTTETGVSIRAWSDGVSTAASTPVVDPDGHTFTVEKTQSGNVKELLYSPAASYSYTTSAINIPLYHQLSRIVVTIIRENTSNTISSVTIGHDSDGNRVPITGTFTKPGSGDNYGSWSVATETSQSTHWSVITPKEETTGSVYSAVVIPTTYTADMRLFNITIGTQTFAYNVPTGGKTFEAGKQYNYTITVGNKGITVTSNITDWTDAADESSTTPDFTHGDGLSVRRTVKMNPLYYVAENNVKSYNSGTKVVTFESNPASAGSAYCYKWSDAMANFAKQTTAYDDYWKGNITDGSSEFMYHLPVIKEWYSILPSMNNVFTTNFLTSGGLVTSAQECIFAYNDDTKDGIDDWSYWSTYTTANVRYAIRYLGTLYCSVWKYEFSGSILSVTAKLIDIYDKDDPSLATVLNNYINNTSFWTTINEDEGDQQRVFYAVGYVYKSNAGGTGTADYYQGKRGHYWSTSQYSSDRFLQFFFDDQSYLCITDSYNVWGFPIRLFRDN